MKKRLVLLLMTVVLAGCAAQDTFETVADEPVLPVMARPRSICVQLPGETALPVMENDNGRVYVCDAYEITVQTLDGGDLKKTVRSLSGRDPDDMMLVQTAAEGIRRTDFVWAAAGEGGEQTGRAAVLDDGNYHYCLTLLQDAGREQKSQINWDQVFASFGLD